MDHPVKKWFERPLSHETSVFVRVFGLCVGRRRSTGPNNELRTEQITTGVPRPRESTFQRLWRTGGTGEMCVMKIYASSESDGEVQVGENPWGTQQGGHVGT